ncbi:MAG: phosphoglucosamine mutase [Clostridiales bacterium]|nr:phosphoglucosamine mutase [Clostridiales bacterium]
MAIYFGTDGIRGVANVQITPDLATRCGNALAQMGAKKVLIGRDTRRSGDMIVCGLGAGLTSGGCDVVDVGILPTPAVAYLTKKYECDFGIVVSASHNPPEYNGIKIFSSQGTKLCDQKEQLVEELMATSRFVQSDKVGRYIHFDGMADYCSFLCDCANASFRGLKVALDCSNGATFKSAKQVFEKLGAKTFVFFSNSEGSDINCGCGSTNPQTLAQKVVKLGCNVGFCFDGDGDRVVAVDEKGIVVDGDKILYILAKEMHANGKLAKNGVVGTFHTNVGIENQLAKLGITLFRSDVGDKYVSNLMKTKGLCLGGEQSGHIVVSQFLGTGDGTLVALLVCKLIQKTPLSKLAQTKLFKQVNVDVVVKDKMHVINNDSLWQEIKKQTQGFDGRVMVRASGTEPKIRVLAESKNEGLSTQVAQNIAQVIRGIDECVE